MPKIKKTKELEKPFVGFKWLSQFAAHDDCRPVLNMIYIDGGNKAGYSCERVAVAADGFRLAVIPVADDMPIGFMPIPKGKTTVEDVVNSQFPAWDMIIPKDVPFTLEVNTAELLASLKIGRGMGEDVCLLWEANPDNTGTLYLYFEDLDGEIVQTIPAKLTGDTTNTLQIALKTKYLLETLTGWQDESTLLGIIKEDKPITIKPSGFNLVDGKYNRPIAVIMPVCFDRIHSNTVKFAGVWRKAKELQASKPQFNMWCKTGARFDAVQHYQAQPDEQGIKGIWDNATPKAEWHEVHTTCAAHVIPDDLVQAHIKLTNCLEKLGWDKTKRQSAGQMVIKGKLTLTDKEKKLVPTVGSGEYIAAIRLAARSLGMVRTDEQRIKAEREVASMVPIPFKSDNPFVWITLG